MQLNKNTDGVLVVDDEKDVCFLLCTYLRNNGIKAEYRLSLEEGKRYIEERSPDVLIVDINLKDGNGLSLLRENLIPEPTDVIVISAQEQKAKEALELGASDFIAKPFTVLEVMQTIRRLQANN